MTMGSMGLAPDHTDRRHLGDLVASEPPPRAPLLTGELAAAPAARIPEVIDDLGSARLL
jgi:hypothetical protein